MKRRYVTTISLPPLTAQVPTTPLKNKKKRKNKYKPIFLIPQYSFPIPKNRQ